MEKLLVKGTWYTVTTGSTCEVVDAEGRPLGTAEAGKQLTFKASTERITFSDDAAEVQAENFKGAPIGLFGASGGTVTSPLPEGYLVAHFLENDGDVYLQLPITTAPGDAVAMYYNAQYTKFTEKKQAEGKNWIAGGSGDIYFFMGVDENARWYGGLNTSIYTIGPADLEWHRFEVFYTESSARVAVDEQKKTSTFSASRAVLNGTIGLWRSANGSSYANNRKKDFHLTVNGISVFDFVPSVNPSGRGVFYNKKDKKEYGKDVKLIVGLTMKQARKLGKHLPEGGGTLKVSLPSNYEEDAGVLNARTEVEAKGWVLDIQTYNAEEGAAATFALRRIWVRKALNEYGSYVDADGNRWSVEWCVDVWGADPQELGYEPYRSVDAAVLYWELVPYVVPEEEMFNL